METLSGFSNGTRAVLSGSYATLKEIFGLIRNAEKKESGYLNLTSFSSLFGFHLTGESHVTALGTLDSIEKNYPVLWIAFDKLNEKDIPATLAELQEGLSVKIYTEKEYNFYLKENGKEFFAAPKRREPRPVAGYEGKVVRTQDLRLQEKYKEIRGQLPEQVAAFIDEEAERNGWDSMEDAVIVNFADIMAAHSVRSVDYDDKIIDTMGLAMAVNKEQFGTMDNIRKGIYSCDELYIDGLNAFYKAACEKEAPEKEEEPERD